MKKISVAEKRSLLFLLFNSDFYADSFGYQPSIIEEIGACETVVEINSFIVKYRADIRDCFLGGQISADWLENFGLITDKGDLSDNEFVCEFLFVTRSTSHVVTSTTVIVLVEDCDIFAEGNCTVYALERCHVVLRNRDEHSNLTNRLVIENNKVSYQCCDPFQVIEVQL